MGVPPTNRKNDACESKHSGLLIFFGGVYIC